MPTDTHDRDRRLAGVAPALTAVLAAGASALVLAACGGSGSSTAANASKSAQTTPGSSRFAALRTCLQKQGITLPSAPAGGGRPGSGNPPSANPSGGGQPRARGFKLPAGVSQSKFQAAMQKCGAGSFAGRRAANRTALTKYAQCMRENGVNLPTPNTSGNGPVFNTKGIDTSSATFKKAQKACRSNLPAAFGAGRPPSGAAGPPAGGAPPGSGG